MRSSRFIWSPLRNHIQLTFLLFPSFSLQFLDILKVSRCSENQEAGPSTLLHFIAQGFLSSSSRAARHKYVSTRACFYAMAGFLYVFKNVVTEKKQKEN